MVIHLVNQVIQIIFLMKKQIAILLKMKTLTKVDNEQLSTLSNGQLTPDQIDSIFKGDQQAATQENIDLLGKALEIALHQYQEKLSNQIRSHIAKIHE